jgi:GMP synthase (glutamine-hydrolysing)
MSISTGSLDVDGFIAVQAENIRRALGTDKAIIAVSGGVDSTTCAALTRQAIGRNLVCVFIDTGFMRRGEPERVKRSLAKPPLRLPLKIVRAQKRFVENLHGLIDAEEKRKKFRETFYMTLADAAERHGCRWLVQGTIAPDLIETEGGIKTQHNVLEQIGINPEQRYGFKVIEPLASLYKPQVRMLSRRLGFAEETSERQPFPGPGLSVRCVGAVSYTKLAQLKAATAIVEKALKDVGAQQYFAAVVENEPHEGPEAAELARSLSRLLGIQEDQLKMHILSTLATGAVAGRRAYGKMAGVTLPPTLRETADEILERSESTCRGFITANPQFTRLLLEIKSLRKKRYAVIVRAVKTDDFLTATAAMIKWTDLTALSSRILRNCKKVSSVYYDLTPKPPATIEFE